VAEVEVDDIDVAAAEDVELGALLEVVGEILKVVEAAADDVGLDEGIIEVVGVELDIIVGVFEVVGVGVIMDVDVIVDVGVFGLGDTTVVDGGLGEGDVVVAEPPGKVAPNVVSTKKLYDIVEQPKL